MMIIIMIAVVLFTLILFIVLIPSYTVSVAQTKELSQKYGKSTFKRFVKEYNKTEWEPFDYSRKYDFMWEGKIPSHFNREYKSELHAGIIIFNDIGMVLNLIDWVRAKHFVKKVMKNDSYYPNPWKEEK